MPSLNKKKLNNKGQTLIEYLIIVVLIGLGSVAAVSKLKQKLNTKFNQVTSNLNKVSPSKTKINNDENDISQNTRSTITNKIEDSLGDWVKAKISE